jgi:BolA protein
MGRDIGTVWDAGRIKTSAGTGAPAIVSRQLTSRGAISTVADMIETRTIDRLRSRLTAAFAPTRLDIVDESARHAGHAGARPGGETHFRVTIVSAVFSGQSRVARQRSVYGVLAQELATQVHALSLTALTPDEAELQL